MFNKILSLINYFYKTRYIHYAVIGLLGTIINLGATYLLTERLRMYYMFSYVFATFGTWAIMFFLHSHITFRGHDQSKQSMRFLKFITVYGIGFATNSALVFLLTEKLHIYYLVSIAFTTVVLSIGTFVLNRRVFGRASV